MKKIILIAVLIIVVIQFFPGKVNSPTVDEGKDAFITLAAPVDVKEIVVSACYDCHSNETKQPWYFKIAPVSWWLVDHVKEGRETLNFSLWSDYDQKQKHHKLKEAVEELENLNMPLKSYTWMHSKANLDDEQRQLLIEWLKEQTKLDQL